tara:strand:- start:122 stop:874 length:753 start_codon:yes stop_codon:yes gene_type:complete
MKNNLLNLKNKICLLSGCNGFIGKAISKKLLSLGSIVIGTDIKEDRSNSGLHMFIKADLNKKNEINKIVSKLKKNYKKIDILINNAGYVASGDKDKKLNKIFYNEKYENLNLTNTIYLTNSLVPILRKSQSASIINISSIYSSLAYDYSLYKNTKMKTPLAYGVSKAGLTHYSKMLSSALAPNIRVNSISPGGIYRKQPKNFIKRYLNKTPLSRMGHENDVANAVIFFSSELSSYITGQNLFVDGGYSIY